MITEFNTSAAPSSNATGGGSNTIVKVIIVAALLYAGYKFIVKPMLDKQAEIHPPNE